MMFRCYSLLQKFEIQSRAGKENIHLPCTLAGDRAPLSLLISSASISSTIGDEDFVDKLLRGDCLSSCFGGTSFRIFITLSTILFPTTTGLTLSLALACNRLIAGIGTELPLLCITPLGGRPLAGENDCLLILPFEAGSTDEDLTLVAPGLHLVAEIGLSGRDVLKLGGASRENPGISDGFHGLGFTVGELGREAEGFLAVLAAYLAEEADEDLTRVAFLLVVLVAELGRRVGVAALDADFDPGVDTLVIGFEDLATGVEDRGGAVALAEAKVAREVGVPDLDCLDADVVDIVLEVAVDVIALDAVVYEGLEAEVKVDLDVRNVGRSVGVEGLDSPEDQA
ncbi:hypothetical protein K7X08_023146 [Anisodus acutangulus]|uniref:Uncharacterized protein n=1 Tax=Anisodus acutangulus TaxID=402998 RepID=A0A9Q1R0T1_9SOLA|nr:hypothetical protein K7X08_023146 [Anisodus acutangulus]